MSSKRSLNELNLIDVFLFSCSTEDNQDAELISKVIIERVTGQKINEVIIEAEKQYKGLNIDERGIRLDICVSEVDKGKIARVYDIEPNKYKQKEIFHRSRYYQSLTDSKKLLISKKFDELPDFTTIWILNYDPFDENCMVYEVKNVVTNKPNVVYNDGVMKYFLYTKGEEGGSKKLKDLLRFFEETCEANAVDDDLRNILEIVNRVKQNEEVGERFMRFENDWDIEKKILQEETAKRSRAEGELSGQIKGIINSGRKFNISEEQIISTLVEECNLTEDEARRKLADN